MAVIPKDEKGVALILTITLVGLIVILTMQFSKSIRAGLYETANFDDGIRLGAIAKSGFNCAMAILYEDATDVDSLLDDWASLNQYSSYSSDLFDNGGNFQAEVTDLTGKIQINKLIITNGENKGEYNETQKALLTRFLKEDVFNLEEDEVDAILNAIKDWIDEDDQVTGFEGAENSYYESLDQPYSCRNAPFESLDELLLVKGITPALFYGTDSTRGISSYLTIQGDGKININTADPIVLEALSDELDSTMIEEIVAYRNDEKNNLNKTDWYKSALGTSEDYIGLALITTKSSYFEITSRGVKYSRSKGITGVVKRSGKTLTILSWKMF
jgi:general secretion pathway protein K